MSGFGAWFGAALRADGVDPEAERRAVAAFRAARAAPSPGARRVRARRRDDWRPAAPRRARLTLRGTLSVALASVALGGVAVAAIGTTGSGADAGRGAVHPARPSVSAPYRPAPAAGSVTPGPSGLFVRPRRPAAARDAPTHHARKKRTQGKRTQGKRTQGKRGQEKKGDKDGNSGVKSRGVAPSSKPTGRAKK
ncbi:hypothetical protein GQF42_26880 [Streptomyces broussonetiae]|uniref:Uncharacterized protein n=1 Tax=Streptomyces broussonetiae TaxID=2686304 RepID=A0A6I6NDU0_9ACTN|nr:hypothetical protein [Streptomyces broussonetiae]QHA06426.1 hypothetical protein GQF42_26880 [Streptomyces broussonetiae]